MNPSALGTPGQCHRQSWAAPVSLPGGTGIWEGPGTRGLQQGRNDRACAGSVGARGTAAPGARGEKWHHCLLGPPPDTHTWGTVLPGPTLQPGVG